MAQIGRNAECPCGSGRKFKRCCNGKLNWDAIYSRGPSAIIRNLTIRGKNLMFLSRLYELLGFDSNPRPKVIEIKKRITDETVAELYRTVGKLWPDGYDLTRSLGLEKGHCNGLFTGAYRPDALVERVVRHSLYSDAILLVDPFMHPDSVRDSFNPVIHPEKYRTTALKFAWLWLTMAPLIYRGIVKFVHTPGEFDPSWAAECRMRVEARRSSNKELNDLFEETAKAEMKQMDEFKEWYMLHSPDDDLRKFHREAYPGDDPESFVCYVNKMRDEHPFFLRPEFKNGSSGEILIETCGADYDMAKSIANLAGAHLVTDMPTRWKEMELDREFGKVDTQGWAPFAKAFGGLEVKFLHQVPVEAALHLRESGRLEDLRSFLKLMWSKTASGQPFSQQNAHRLAQELEHHVREAEAEWTKIDADLIKYLGAVGGVTSAFFLKGGLDFVAAAATTVTAGAASMGAAHFQRKAFHTKYPAGFFLKLKNGTFA